MSVALGHRPRFLHASIVLVCLLIGACASTSSVHTRYLDDNATAARSLLLTARMPEPLQRRDWETACIDQLQSAGLRIVSSYSVMPQWYQTENPADNQALLEQARNSDLDAVLVAELSDLLLAPMQLPPRNQVSEERFSGPQSTQPARWQFWFGTDAAAEPPLQRQTTVRLVSADGETRWEGELSTHEANDLGAIANSQCRALKHALTELGLLP